MSFIMGCVTAMLQRHDADGLREELEANDEGIALFRAATRLLERFEETRRHGFSARGDQDLPRSSCTDHRGGIRSTAAG
jgi:hypothetical protein